MKHLITLNNQQQRHARCGVCKTDVVKIDYNKIEIKENPVVRGRFRVIIPLKCKNGHSNEER